MEGMEYLFYVYIVFNKGFIYFMSGWDWAIRKK